MSDTDLLFMPAVKAAALIRARKLSPVDYVDAVLKAIEGAQPRLADMLDKEDKLVVPMIKKLGIKAE